MGRVANIAGERFGRLLAIRPTAKRDSHTAVIWEFYCDCGNKYHFSGTAIKSVNKLSQEANVPSCGCYKEEFVYNRKEN